MGKHFVIWNVYIFFKEKSEFRPFACPIRISRWWGQSEYFKMNLLQPFSIYYFRDFKNIIIEDR
jgi:hypothetical protein